MKATSKYTIFINAIVMILIIAVVVQFINKVKQDEEDDWYEALEDDMQSVTGVLESNVYVVRGSLESADWGVYEYLKYYPDSLFGITHGLLNSNSSISGVSCCINEKFIKGGVSKLFMSYRDSLGVIHDAEKEGDFLKSRIWKRAIEKKDITFIDPYISPISKELVFSFVKPCYTRDSIPYCELAFNFRPSMLDKIVRRVLNEKYFKVFIVSNNDIVISAPEEEWMLKKYSELQLPYNSRKYLFLEDDLPLMDCKIYLFCDFQSYFQSSNETWSIILYSFMGLGALIALLYLLIYKLHKSRKRLIASMLEQQKSENEVRTARNIQLGMLSNENVLADLPDHIKVRGLLKTAKDVGGDLYDYIFRDGKLIFCIGDVSGKGLPASLFMTAAISVFRVEASHSDSPAEIVSQMNNSFATYSPDGMFVTMIIGIFDPETGCLTYTNAGHNPPIFIGKDKVDFIPLPFGTPVAFFKGTKYGEMQLQLAPGAAILLYTDGLNEAKDINEEFFGDERLLAACSALKGKDAPEVVDGLSSTLADFIGAAEQFDDITMLCISSKLHPE